MIYGPEIVVECPRCHTRCYCFNQISGDLSCERFWTDGRRLALRWTPGLSVIQCHGCKTAYWTDSAEKVGTIDRDAELFHQRVTGGEPIDSPFSDVRRGREPTEGEYLDALETGLGQDRERELRILTWWRRNDSLRHLNYDQDGPESSNRWRDNLHALIALLDPSIPAEAVMRAEAMRELGEFEVAMQELAGVRSEALAGTVALIRELCKSGDRFVREVKS